jgi:hypothetical protein
MASRQLYVMRTISHPAFLEFRNSHVVGNDLWIVTAQAQGTLLSDLLVRHHPLPHPVIAKISFEVSSQSDMRFTETDIALIAVRSPELSTR